MNRSVVHRLLALFLVLAVSSLATAVVAHAHPSAKSQHDSHCRICMAAHSGTYALVAVRQNPSLVQNKIGVVRHSNPTLFVSLYSSPTQGRAPPKA